MYNKHVSWSAVQVPHRILFSRAELSKKDKSYIASVRITQTNPPEAEGRRPGTYASPAPQPCLSLLIRGFFFVFTKNEVIKTTLIEKQKFNMRA